MGMSGQDAQLVQEINVVLGQRQDRILTLELSRFTEVPQLFPGLAVHFGEFDFIQTPGLWLLNDALSCVMIESVVYQPSDNSYLCYCHWVAPDGVSSLQDDGTTAPIGNIAYFDESLGGTKEFNLLEAVRLTGWHIDSYDVIEHVPVNGQTWRVLFQRQSEVPGRN